MAKFMKQPDKKRHTALWLTVLLLSLGLLVCAALVLLPMLTDPQTDTGGVADETTLPSVTDPAPDGPNESETMESTEALPDNPIDWDYYEEVNDDIYAWIYVPNTGIDLPILQPQGSEDDNYYLHRDLDRNYLYSGSLYTQRANAKDFSDPVTLIYGHNMRREGVMFTNLLYFQDTDFFNENEFFYIYTPGHILTYRIASAHSYDTRHILNSFDFSQEEELQEYFDYILSPRTMVANVREGVTLTTEDHVVTLSTCIYFGSDKQRYLLQGVLVDDQQTN